STTVDYGVYLQFLAQRGHSEVPLCAAMPQHLCLAGLDEKDIVGVHTYCRDDVLEVIDARYLTKLPKTTAAPGGQQGKAKPQGACMKTIAIPQFYCGPSGQKGMYNRQEVGLARAFAALGARAVVLYPAPGAAAPVVEDPEPNVRIYTLPAWALGSQAFYKSWQVLLAEHADAVHVMGDNAPGVPGLYRFCRRHGILFYSQIGALKSTSPHAAVRAVMDLLLRRNLAVYQKTPTYAKTPAAAAELQALGVRC